MPVSVCARIWPESNWSCQYRFVAELCGHHARIKVKLSVAVSFLSGNDPFWLVYWVNCYAHTNILCPWKVFFGSASRGAVKYQNHFFFINYIVMAIKFRRYDSAHVCFHVWYGKTDSTILVVVLKEVKIIWTHNRCLIYWPHGQTMRASVVSKSSFFLTC